MYIIIIIKKIDWEGNKNKENLKPFQELLTLNQSVWFQIKHEMWECW